jgi:hypothetical protein
LPAEIPKRVIAIGKALTLRYARFHALAHP